MSQPFVSTRQSIAWIPSTPPYEDSDVLVLSSRSTSPGNVGATLFYLDLRLSLPLSRSSTVTWGFSGLRHTLSTSPLRLRWDHYAIDSRGDGMADEGEIIHRDGTEIETGIGLNPATGQQERYEEIWRDPPLPAGSPYIFVASSTNVGEATATMAVLGPHALALTQEPESVNMPRKFHAVRLYRQRDGHDTRADNWELVFSTGSSVHERTLKELARLVDETRHLERGDHIYLGNRTWVVWDNGSTG